jgi:hypothetical protein
VWKYILGPTTTINQFEFLSIMAQSMGVYREVNQISEISFKNISKHFYFGKIMQLKILKK